MVTTRVRAAPSPRQRSARQAAPPRLRGPEAKARYRFEDRSLLDAALTHRSYLHEHPGERAKDFERLEFLGDAVLGLVVGERLFLKFPGLREGELTALRASLVSGTALASIGTRLGLPDAARLGRGEEESGGRTRHGLAASLYEAFVGAVYVDGGLEAARKVIERTMARELRAARSAPPKTSKTVLQELAQAQRFPLPGYRTVGVSGPEHRREFLVEVEIDGRTARGSGGSKREAEEAAAASLLTSMIGASP